MRKRPREVQGAPLWGPWVSRLRQNPLDSRASPVRIGRFNFNLRGVYMAGKSDKAFMRSFAKVLALLFVLAIVFVILAGIFGSEDEDQSTVRNGEIAERLSPIATIVTDADAQKTPEVRNKATSQPQLSGKQVVGQVCSACHASGVLGAPKIGDATEWHKRFNTQGGLDGLVHHAIHGLRSMPPRGGNPGLTDQEIHNAVKYMLSKAGIST